MNTPITIKDITSTEPSMIGVVESLCPSEILEAAEAAGARTVDTTVVVLTLVLVTVEGVPTGTLRVTVSVDVTVEVRGGLVM